MSANSRPQDLMQLSHGIMCCVQDTTKTAAYLKTVDNLILPLLEVDQHDTF